MVSEQEFRIAVVRSKNNSIDFKLGKEQDHKAINTFDLKMHSENASREGEAPAEPFPAETKRRSQANEAQDDCL
jgi:hypothetical protein